jgi:phosphoserine phosphatase RsbU/P
LPELLGQETSPGTAAAAGRLLVVDDNEMNRDMLSRRLRRLGYEVDVACDGAEALGLLSADSHDVLLLDIMMPGLDGYQVLERVKADAALRDLPVIMISALDDVDSVVRCIELGADDHLPKPFNPVILRARVGACLEKKRLRDVERLHARSLERELEIGRQIQAGFLPDRLPVLPGWEISARFQPARQVAGDFYDVFTVADGGLTALVVADVCGKGVGAALFMALFRSLLRATALQRFDGAAAAGAAPGAGLRENIRFVNEYIARTHSSANMFATAFCALLDPASGTLHYVNAGHDPPVLAGAGGVRAVLEPTGPALGLMPGLEFQARTATIEPGETLLAYTDGVIDARSPSGAAFGEDRLLALAPRFGGAAGALLAGIDAALSEHTAQGAPYDDITLLAVSRSA